MKKTILLFVLLVGFIKAQTIPSTCVSTDSITNLWNKEAARLALRRTYKVAGTYKDSVKPDPILQKRYLSALLAVYNATAITETDTLFKQLFVRTKPDPEMDRLRVNASASLSWMLELFNNQAPTTNPVISNLMVKYNMSYLYLQSFSNDVVVFMPDSALNLPVLIPQYLSQGAISATNEAAFDDTRDITDSLNTNFVLLTYSYGWNTCNDGCDFRRLSTFKVYADCSVEYLGTTGASLYLGINKAYTQSFDFSFVNPTKNQFCFTSIVPIGRVRIYGADGRYLEEFECTPEQKVYPLFTLQKGVYFAELKTKHGKIVKQLLIED